MGKESALLVTVLSYGSSDEELVSKGEVKVAGAVVKKKLPWPVAKKNPTSKAARITQKFLGVEQAVPRFFLSIGPAKVALS